MQSSSSSKVLNIVRESHKAATQLAQTSAAKRRLGVSILAKAIGSSFDEILEANTLDLEMSREMAIAEPIADWLKLTPERLEMTVSILKQLSKSADPTRRLINASYQLEPSQTYCQLIPLGTIALVYEAFPELAAIAAGMCLKTGNSLIARGCSAASNSNQAIANILQKSLAAADLPPNSFGAISPDSGISVQELVTQDRYLNLVIPYGRPSLVQQVAEKATATVLKTTIGNCYLYWSISGNLDLIRQVVVDSHDSEPDAVNAIEKVLVNHNIKSPALQALFNSLQQQGFHLRGDEVLVEAFPEYLSLMESGEWRRPYLRKIVAFRFVENLPQAVSWINRYSSGHADSIVTESYRECRQFVRDVDSALVYINTSPRFSRNPEGGEDVFLGMSNQKGYRQGLISVETFTTIKQIVQG
ncbi:glutamate-5-semialdehyde dehydrogenase [Waterburya agarophytonicola K14]|uniref:Gamma-glutamyl phosphate reductase n=1 Tax=Waterburya agarophytonicola KI4 TaxID=2874699 RepID=A0A964FFB5_9CYAN|nr:glutamate-5-semialdehyde dehydrogenase [Waterburya agarophytonicola]MCC0176787.1 glutamate-5-semialdehyde dehydrogenase [Waterburya agarophytonicola KI4]